MKTALIICVLLVPAAAWAQSMTAKEAAEDNIADVGRARGPGH